MQDLPAAHPGGTQTTLLNSSLIGTSRTSDGEAILQVIKIDPAKDRLVHQRSRSFVPFASQRTSKSIRISRSRTSSLQSVADTTSAQGSFVVRIRPFKPYLCLRRSRRPPIRCHRASRSNRRMTRFRLLSTVDSGRPRRSIMSITAVAFLAGSIDTITRSCGSATFHGLWGDVLGLFGAVDRREERVSESWPGGSQEGVRPSGLAIRSATTGYLSIRRQGCGSVCT